MKSIFEAKDDVSILFVLGKVTIKGMLANAVNPVVISVTEIGVYVAPIGTVTVSDVELAELTAAFTAPKYTTLLLAVKLKFVPLMVTVAPIGPEVGVNEVIVGGPNGVALTSLLNALSNLALSIAVTLK